MKFTEQKDDFAHLGNRQSRFYRKADQMQDKQSSLVLRLKRGDHTAAEQLVDLYYKRIYLFMRKMGHDCHTSEDLTQDCFLRAWNHIGQLKDKMALNSWIYRIAANISKLYWRRCKNRKPFDIDGVNIQDSNAKNSVDRVEDYEQLCQLRLMILQLPTKLKQAVVLHYMQHLTINEAAQALGINVGTFKSRLSRALKTLKDKLG